MEGTMPATIIIIVVLAAICAFAVRSIIVKANRGCCGGASDKTERVKKSAEGCPYHYIIEVGGMSCEKCAARIENAFNRRDGFSASVNLAGGIAEVNTAEPVSELILRKTICDLGYSAGKITVPDEVRS